MYGVGVDLCCAVTKGGHSIQHQSIDAQTKALEHNLFQYKQDLGERPVERSLPS